MMLIVSTFHTPAGWLVVEYDEHSIYKAFFTDKPGQKSIENNFTSVIQRELDHYINNPQHHFQLALKPIGTPYQLRVWEALLHIPAGSPLSYGELANSLQSSPRAIGQACKRNPITLFIPCHRVVGKTTLGGYMGRADALCYKTALIEHELLAAKPIAFSA